MTIPTYDALMLPVLRLCAESTWQMRDLAARISDDLGLTQAERDQQLPGGGTTVIHSRVGWAKTYLKKAGLLEQPRRGMVLASDRGRAVLRSSPAKIDSILLRQFEEFRAFQRKPSEGTTAETAKLPLAEPTSTPEEQIIAADKAITEALRDALLTRILEESPSFFEKLILDLLHAMGYGGSRADAGEQLGRTGDEGVDGVIREDQLGLDRVYLQAKRYRAGNVVGSEAVRAFIGALIGKGAHKGVLITTSSFSNGAKSAADQSGSLRLVLIDGTMLTSLMVQFNVGVRVARTVEIKSVDKDYFPDGETE